MYVRVPGAQRVSLKLTSLFFSSKCKYLIQVHLRHVSSCNENRDTHILICPRELCNSVGRKVAILSDERPTQVFNIFLFLVGMPL